MSDLLPPATQQFILDAAAWVAGMDEMIAATDRLTASMTAAMDAAERMRAVAAQSAGAADVGAAGAAASSGGAEAAAAASAETGLSDAQRAAADAADAAASAQTRLGEAEKVSAGVAGQAATAQKVLGDAEKSAAASAEAATATTAKATEGGKLLAAQAVLSGRSVSELGRENGNLMQTLTKVGGATILAAGAFTAYGMKSAADFQQQILRLKTSAGNTGDFLNGKFTGDLKVASDGILKMSVDTGTSAKELAQGMYVVQSANIKVNGSAIGAADALKILRAAAEGAKIEGADTGTVVNALTTVMNDYHLSVSQAVPAMNALIAGVSSGKTNLQDLAGAMHSVMPIASSVHLSLGEVIGALSTMTAHGVSADLAGQHLANMMRNLVAPSQKARDEMSSLGLNATDVAQHLGDRGLTGTLDLLFKTISQAVDKKTGLVLTQQLDKSKEAAAQAKAEFAQMPASVQKLATAFLDGSGNVKGFGAEVSKLPLSQQELLKAFEANSKKATGFSEALKGNKVAAQTFDEALKKVSGGAVGLEAALQLTGENMDGFKSAVSNVNTAMQHGGAHVENWQKVQKTFNVELDQAKQAVNRVAITIGTELLPKVQAVMAWLSQHPALVKDIAIAVGVFLAAAAAIKVMSIAMGILNVIMDANPIGLIILAIAALVAGFIYLWTHVKGFRDFWLGAWADLQAAARNTWRFLETVWHGIVAGFDFVKDHWRLIITLMLGPLGLWIALVTKYWTQIKDTLVAGFDFVKDHWRFIISLMLGPLGVWIALVTKYWSQIVGVFKAAFDAVAAYGRWWWDNAKPVFDHFVAGLHLIADAVLWWWHSVMEPAYKFAGQLILAWYNGVVKPAFGLVVAAVHLLAEAFLWWWHSIVEPAFRAVEAVVSAAASAVVGYFRWWVGSVQTVLGWFGQLGALFGGWFMAAYNAVVTAIGRVFTFVAGIPGTVVRLLAGLYDDMLQIGKNVVIGLWNGLVSMGQWLWNQVTGWIKSVIPGPIAHVLGISSPSKLMHEYGEHVGEGLARGIVSKHERVRRAAAGLAKAVSAGVTGSPIPTPQFQAVSRLVTTAADSLQYASSGGGYASASNTALVTTMVPVAPAPAAVSSSAGGAAPVVVNVHVQGSVISNRDLENHIQQAVLRMNVRNPTNNLSLAAGR